MAHISGYETKNNKNSKDRYDIYESEFETPLKTSDFNANIIDKNLREFTELCSFLR